MDEKALYALYKGFIQTYYTYSQRYSLDVKFLSLAMCLIVFFQEIVYSPFQEAAIGSPILYFISTLST